MCAVTFAERVPLAAAVLVQVRRERPQRLRPVHPVPRPVRQRLVVSPQR